jgi:Kdo2-lipid IVA lauroyltransferase/acyltransferase
MTIIKHYFEFFILRLAFFLFSNLKFKNIYFISEKIGILFYKFFFIRKKTVFNNLKIVLVNKSELYYNTVAKNVCINFAKTFFEFFKLSSLNKDNIDDYVKFYNLNIIDDLLKKKKGVILVSAHIDNWELIGAALAIKGYPVVALAKSQKNKLADKFVIKVREHSGLKIVLKGYSVKELFRILKKNQIAGMIGDVRGRDKNPNSILFNKQVSTPIGTALMSYKTGAPVLPLFIYRDKYNRHHLIVEEPITSESENKDVFVSEIINKYNKRLENFVLKHPDQWFYFHKRFKVK